jgi:hypothetical protein
MVKDKPVLDATKQTTPKRLFLVLLLEVTWFHAASASDWPREELVARLRHQEALVASMDCEYQLTSALAPAETVRLIEEYCRTHPKNPPATSYISKRAPVERSQIRWKRKGVKERLERLEGRDAPSVKAFDGQLVRSLGVLDGALGGMIENASQAHWYQVNPLNPYSLLYEYCREPFSSLVAKGRDYVAKRSRLADWEGTEVMFGHPTTEWLTFRLRFNDTGELTDRAVIGKLPWDEEPRVIETHELREYERVVQPSGEDIAFPRRAIFRVHMGQTRDGRLIECWSETLRVEKLAFNVAVPDSEFTIDFPQNIKVSDRLHEDVLGVRADTDESGAEVASATGLSTRWQLILAVHGAILLGAVGYVIARRRSRRRGAPN